MTITIALTGVRSVAVERKCDHCGSGAPDMVLRSAATGVEECYHWRCATEAHPEMAEELGEMIEEFAEYDLKGEGE